MNNITYRIMAPVSSNGDSYNFSILCKDDLDSASEPLEIMTANPHCAMPFPN